MVTLLLDDDCNLVNEYGTKLCGALRRDGKVCTNIGTADLDDGLYCAHHYLLLLKAAAK